MANTTDAEKAEAVARLFKTFNKVGLVVISVEALREIRGFTDDVECPYCAKWFRASVTEPDEEVEVVCPWCQGAMSVQMVRYLVVSDYP